MNKKDKRLAELCKWFSKNPEFANIPFIQHKTMDQYHITEKTAYQYAVEVMRRLKSKVSKLQREKDRTSRLHYPKFVKANEL